MICRSDKMGPVGRFQYVPVSKPVQIWLFGNDQGLCQKWVCPSVSICTLYTYVIRYGSCLTRSKKIINEFVRIAQWWSFVITRLYLVNKVYEYSVATRSRNRYHSLQSGWYSAHVGGFQQVVPSNLWDGWLTIFLVWVRTTKQTQS